MLLKLRDAAAYLTVSERVMQRLLAAGKIPYIRVAERRIAVEQSALDDYISGARWQSGVTETAEGEHDSSQSSSKTASAFLRDFRRWQRGGKQSRSKGKDGGKSSTRAG